MVNLYEYLEKILNGVKSIENQFASVFPQRLTMNLQEFKNPEDRARSSFL
jgi:hypothetical protein